MTATDILTTLWQAEISVRLTPDHQNLVVPAGRLTLDQRALVIENKPELIRLLIDAAMRVCDRHNDTEAARLEMRDQSLALPPHLQADLLEHFNGTKK